MKKKIINASWIDGITLRQCILDMSLTNLEKSIIFLSLLTGLQRLHKNGIIHRDLTPDNIIVNTNLEASIIDFGLNTVEDGSRKHTSNIGTLLYRAPEVNGCDEKCNYSFNADIYSLGMILLFMEIERDPPDFDKRLNPADALDEYFGVAHSPDVRFIIGMMCDPRPKGRTPIEDLIEVAKQGIFPTSSRNEIVPGVNEEIIDGVFAAFLNGASFFAPIFIRGFCTYVASQTLYTAEAFFRGAIGYDVVGTECEIDSFEWRTDEFYTIADYSSAAYDLNESRYMMISGYFNNWIQRTMEDSIPDHPMFRIESLEEIMFKSLNHKLEFDEDVQDEMIERKIFTSRMNL